MFCLGVEPSLAKPFVLLLEAAGGRVTLACVLLLEAAGGRVTLACPTRGSFDDPVVCIGAISAGSPQMPPALAAQLSDKVAVSKTAI